jgi:pyrroline-5-carboxylate reductase
MNNIGKLAFIGGGHMATAVISGMTKRGLPAMRLVVADPNQGKLNRQVRDFAIQAAADNLSAVQRAEVVVLAVKPQQMRAVALRLAPHLATVPPSLKEFAQVCQRRPDRIGE